MYEIAREYKNQEKQNLPFNQSTNKLIHSPNTLKSQAPFVSIQEINDLRQLIAKASSGEYFLIQSSDSAESFYECDQDTTYAKLDFIQQLAEFFQRKTGGKVIQVSQIAGKYTNPRINPSDTPSKNEKIYSELSDTVNQIQNKRQAPDPWQMFLTYNCSSFIYREINNWNQGIKPEQKTYTSHEASLLYYHQALTQFDEQSGLYYNLSTHFPCLDQCMVNSAPHISYLKKIANPIAIKIGPNTSIKNLINTLNELDPDYIPGRITLIPGLGAQSVHRILPQLIEAVNQTQRTVLWSCDPIHENTETSTSGINFSKLSNIVEEIKSSFLIHRVMGSKLNAIHIEATNLDVTECVDYESSIFDLETNFQKSKNCLADPRLNYEQAIHVIQQIAKYYAG